MSREHEAELHILDILDGFIRSKILMTAYRLDVFTLLARTPMTAEQALEKLDLPPRSGTILLNGCLALGLLESVDGKLRTKPDAAPFLLRGPDQPFRLSSYLIDYYAAVYPQLDDMEALIRTNGASSTFSLRPYFKDASSISADMAAQYSGYMRSTMPEIADVVMEIFDFSPFRYLVDVCGGPGTFCRKVLERHSNMRGAFLDVPSVVELGVKELASADPALKERIRPLPGDMFQTELPREADVITMCRSAHDWGEDEVMRVFQRISAVLPPHGKFLIIERMLPEEFSPEAENLYMRSIYFLVKSKNNEYRRPSRYREMLRSCGFTEVEVLEPKRDPHVFFRGLRVAVAGKR